MNLSSFENKSISVSHGILYGTTGLIGFLLNLVALTGLNKCGLTYSTSLLMKIQCSMNLIGLFVKGLTSTMVCFTGQRFPSTNLPPIIYHMPGAVVVFAVYSQYALQAAMAINRYCIICHRVEAFRWFSNTRSVLYTCICLFHGFWQAVMCLFPCCLVYYDEFVLTWVYKGTGASSRKAITIISDFICCSVMILFYSMTFYKLRRHERKMSHRQLLRLRSEQQRERKVLLQLFAVGCTWLGYSLCYRPLYYIPTISHWQPMVTVSELVRFWLLCVDPVIYLIFMKKLRHYVLSLVTRSQIPHVESNNNRRTVSTPDVLVTGV